MYAKKKFLLKMVEYHLKKMALFVTSFETQFYSYILNSKEFGSRIMNLNDFIILT